MTDDDDALIALDVICRSIPERENHHTASGKWKEAGVPHRGWTCVEVIDLFDHGLDEDNMATCQMCQIAQIRYAHLMQHDNYPETLAVGCICAENMLQDYINPSRREHKLRLKAQRQARELRRQQKPEVANALTFVKATEEIIAAGSLSSREESFVYEMRAIARHNAAPRTRKRQQFTPRQLQWLRALYLRIPAAQRTWSPAA